MSLLVNIDKFVLTLIRMIVRRHYPIDIIVNGRKIIEVVIDPHYEERHSDTINDPLILELVML
jgi:hypothetical protein